MVEANEVKVYTLNALDRCDACQSRAYVRVTLPTFKQLFFCAHHGRRFEDTLRPTSLDWLDESDAVVAK